MKKVLAALGILLVIGILGAIGYVAFFMAEDGPSTVLVDQPRTESEPEAPKQPGLNVKKKADTPADVLEALDYETGKNPDTVGWLKIAGTDINNSVLQSHDNTAYLRRNERRQEDLYGCYFADYMASIGTRDELSGNTVIYGHSDLKDNPDGPRFSQLFRFTDPEFARNTPVIEFSTLEDFMNWQVFAVFYTDVGFNYIDTELSGAALASLAGDVKKMSLYDYGVQVGPDDHILTLSTCTVKYGADDNSHRFVVMAKLLPEGAELPARADLTVQNPLEA